MFARFVLSATVIAATMACFCGGTASADEALSVTDWSAATKSGWTFLDGRTGGHDGRIRVLDGRLRLEDDGDGQPDWAEAALGQKLDFSDRVTIDFRARFLRLGMADEGTGNLSILRLLIGLKTARGPFGVNLSFLRDRFNVDSRTHVFRTDEKWHDWRLEIDAARKTAAMFRDGEYVCLHEAGSAQEPGLRFQLQGAKSAPAEVEIDALHIRPAGPQFTDGRKPNRRAPPEIARADWPLWRRDLRNTALSPLAGDLKSAPEIAWSHLVGKVPPDVELVDLDGDGRDEILLAGAGTLAAHDDGGTLLWAQRLDNVTLWACDDLDGDGQRELVVTAGPMRELRVLSVRDGRTRWQFDKLAKNGVAGVRIARLDPSRRELFAIVWSALQEIGYGLSFANADEPVVEWSFDWKKTFFDPCTALADMDRDGRLDLVAVTYNSVFVFDTATGKPKLTLDWNSGRNYGTLVVRDVDGDGWPDVVVLADVLREHIAVIRNEQGRGLRLLWDRFYEQNYPDDHAALRVVSESVDDFDGDGRFEVAFSEFDDRAQGRWRTLLVDAVTGKPSHELDGLYLVGAGPLFPGKPSVLLVSRPSGREKLETGRLEIWGAAEGHIGKIADLPPGNLLTTHTPRSFPLATWVQLSRIRHGKPTAVLQSVPGVDSPPGLLLAQQAGRQISFLTGEGSDRPLKKGTVPLGGADMPRENQSSKRESSKRDSPLFQRPAKVRETWHSLLPGETPAGSVAGFLASREKDEPPRLVHAGTDGKVRVIASGRRTAEIPFSAGPVVSPLVARLRANEPPSILFVDGEPRLHCLRVTSPAGPAEPAWSCPAHGWTTPYVPAVKTLGVPHIADIDGDAQPEVLVAREPDLLVALDSTGGVRKSWTFPARPTQWAVGHFDDDAVPDLVVSYPLGPILDTAMVVVSGESGKTLWRAHCGNGPLALHDLDGDAIDDVILRDLYERRTLDGRTGRDLVPIVMQPGYHTPVLPELDSQGAVTGLFWLGGTWSITADARDGASLWTHWLAPTGIHAVADVDGDGRMEVGGVTAGPIYKVEGGVVPIDGPDGEFLCHDLATGKLKWSLPLGTRSPGCVSADLDGDGRHEFLLGTDDGRLLALRGAAPDAGQLLWEKRFPAAVGVPVICDADGDGRIDLVVGCADGNLYCLHAARKGASR